MLILLGVCSRLIGTEQFLRTGCNLGQLFWYERLCPMHSMET